MRSHGRSTTQPAAADQPAAWVAVVPVKPLRAAKTRLRGAVPDAVHPDLVLAMARDTVAAALACRAVARVVVICDDPVISDELTALGALCLPDAPAAGLNAALSYGAQAAQRTSADTDSAHRSSPGAQAARRSPPGAQAHHRSSPGTQATHRPTAPHHPSKDLSGADLAGRDVLGRDVPPANAARAGAAQQGTDAARGATDAVAVVALTADLPAMRPEDLESALVAAARAGRRAFVPDLEGTGTVLLAAPAGEALAPQFGPGSAAAHLRSGAARLEGAWPSLRRDVDTPADLDAAARLGLGAHTGQVICTVA
jgi:2-phospho-L-lactate guanylyltransferase